METKEKVNMGNYDLDVKKEWSPYNPIDFQYVDTILKLKAPTKAQMFDWYTKEVFGYSGLSAEKYLSMDSELLQDTLKDLLISNDAFTLLKWIYSIASYRKHDDYEVIHQMPEDFIKCFLLDDDEYKEMLAANKIVVFGKFKIEPIHDNSCVYTGKDDTTKCYLVYSLKYLALWILELLAMLHGTYDKDEEFECTYNEVCAAYQWYQNLFWAKVSDESLQYEYAKYMDGGQICSYNVVYLSMSDILDSIESVYKQEYKTPKENSHGSH